MPAPRPIRAGANAFFRHAPNALVYRLHRRRRIEATALWAGAPYQLIHIPKSGGQSVAAALGLPSAGHIPWRDLPAALRAQNADKPLLAVIRDPVARLRSTFLYARMLHERTGSSKLAAVADSPSLAHFVRHGLERQRIETHFFLRPAADFVAGAPGGRLHLVPFERLEEGLAAFHARIGHPPLPLPHRNRTEVAAPAPVDLDAEALAVVRRLYAEDFQLHERLAGRALLAPGD